MHCQKSTIAIMYKADGDFCGTTVTQSIIDGFLNNPVKMRRQQVVRDQNRWVALKFTPHAMQFAVPRF